MDVIGMRKLNFLSKLCIVLLFFLGSEAYSSRKISFQTKIIRPDGTNLEASAVNFKFTLTDPSGSCIIYSEIFSNVDMSSSSGSLTLLLGNGARSYPSGGVLSWSTAFDNKTASYNCAPPSSATYTPVAGDARKLYVQFNDGSTAGSQMLPAMEVSAVPYAMYADSASSLDDHPVADFVLKGDVSTCGGGQVLTYNGSSFSCVTAGTNSGGASGYNFVNTTTNGATNITAQPNGTATSSGIAVYNSSSGANNSYGSIIAGTSAVDIRSGVNGTGTQLPLTFTVGSSEAMRFDTSGNMGVGTNAPTSKLDVSGALTMRGMTAPSVSGAGQGRIYFDSVSNKFKVSENGGVYVDLLGAGSSGFVNGGNSFGANATLGTSDNYNLSFKTNNTTQMTIDNTGKVGIGTATPGAKLDVAGAVNVSDATGIAIVATETATTGTNYGVYSGAQGIGATSNIGGFFVATGATNNYGIRVSSALPVAATNWAFYSGSGAQSYFAGNLGIGTSTPGSALDVKGTLRLSGSTSGYVGFAPAAAAGSTTYTLPAADGTASQVLTTNGSGTLSWSTPAGSITSVGGTAPISSSGGATPTISIAQSNTTTDGYLSSTDWNTFNNKLGTATSFSGDVSGAYNSTSVDKIKGKTVSPAAYSAGQVLRYDGTNWVNTALGFSDLSGKPTTLAGYGITDAQSSTLASGKLLVGNGSNVATAVSMSGDATMDNAGAVTLATVPVSKGGTNVTSFTANKIVGTNGTGTALTSFSCALGEVITFDVSGAAICQSVAAASGAFVNGGNSYGANATLGTSDNYNLSFKTNNTTQMTIDNTGKVGVGITPASDTRLTLKGSTSDVSAYGLVIKDSSNGNIFKVRNDGQVNIDGGAGFNVINAVSTLYSINLVRGVASGPQIYDGSGSGGVTVGPDSTTKTLFVGNNVGIGTISPGSALDVKGTLRLSGSTSGYVGFAPAAAAGSTTYTLPAADGTASQVLTTNGSGVLSWSTPAGSITSVGGTAPISSSGGATPTISIAQSNTTTDGYLSSTDWNTFNNKLGTGTSFSGDVSGAYNSTSVDKIKGKTVSPAAYSAGQVLRYDGTNWVNTALGFSDLSGKPTTLAGYGITDAQSSTLASGKLLVGNGSNVATAVSMSGDATMDNAGAVTLATVPVSKGGTNVTSFTANKIVGTNGTGTALTSFSCALGEVITFDVSGAAICQSVAAASGAFVNGGNSYGANATLGTSDNYNLSFKTNNTTQMTIDNTGNVGVGTATPSVALHISKAQDVPLRIETSSTYAAGFDLWNGGARKATFGVVGLAGQFVAGSAVNDMVFRPDAGGDFIFGNSAQTTQLFKITNAGKVGIGTATPTQPLTVEGDIQSQKTSGGVSIRLSNSGGNQPLIYMSGVDGSVSSVIQTLGALWLSTSGSTRAVITSTGNFGIGTISPGSALDVKGTLRLSGSTSGYVGFAPAAAAGSTTYTLPAADGTASQVLTTNGSGTLSWSTPAGSITSVGGTAPISSSGGATPTISIAQSNTTTDGYLSSTDWNTFNNKLGTATSFSGDVSGAYNSTSVDKIKGKTVSPAAYSAGQVLRYDGTNWVNTALGFSDLSGKPTTLAGYGITDAQSSTLASGKLLVGNGSNVATAVSMSGDATMDNAGAVTLATVPVSKGGTNVTSFTANKIVGTNGTGTALTSFSCPLNQVITFDVTGTAVCSSVSSLSTGYVNGGNSFGANATLGTSDNYKLSFNTNNTTQMTIDTSGNVGIGTTSPSAKLDVNGSGNFSGVLSFPGGVGANPGFHFSSVGSADSYGANIGFGLDTSANIVAAVSNVGFKVVNSSGGVPFMVSSSGYVGVGTSSPSVDLHVKNTTTYSQIMVESSGSNADSGVRIKDTAGDWKIGNNIYGAGANKFGIFDMAALSNRLIIDSAGRVGIGELNPTSKLQISSGTDPENSNATPIAGLAIADVTALAMGVSHYSPYEGWIQVRNATVGGGTYPLSLQPMGGNVGIGTTSPGSTLDVKGTLRLSGSTSGYVGFSPAAAAGSTTYTLPSADGSSGQFLKTNGSGTLSWGTALTSGSSFSAANGTAGAPGITFANSATAGLYSQGADDVTLGVSSGSRYIRLNGSGLNVNSSFTLGNGTVGGGKAYQLEMTRTGSTQLYPTSGYLQLGPSSASTTLYVAANIGVNNSSPSYQLDVTGDINTSTGLRVAGTQVCTSSGCTASSDRRLKENIAPLENSLENLLKLEGVSYDWKDKKKYSSQHQIGLIAQDLEKVYPEVVVTDEKTGLKSVAYDHLIAPVIEAIRSLNAKIEKLFEGQAYQSRQIASIAESQQQASGEQQKKIEKLEQENAELKNRLDRLEKALLNQPSK